MGRATRDAFVNNTENFLRDNALVVRGAWGQTTRTPGTTVGTIRDTAGATLQQHFPLGTDSTAVNLAAPRVAAYFSRTDEPVRPELFPFSAPKVTVTLDAPNNAEKTLPVYLIPFRGGTAHGVQLPADGDVTFALTASQNGCTVEVSGDPSAPFASHTNVIDATAPQRQDLLLRRLAQLQHEFSAVSPDGGSDQNRLQFGHYRGTAGVTNVNYTERSRHTVRDQFTQFFGQRRRKFRAGDISYKLARDAMALDPSATAQAQIVAKREGERWIFYYQVWNALSFETRTYDQHGVKHPGPTETVLVVLAWGQLWPNRTIHTRDVG